MIQNIQNFIREWRESEDGLAAVEASLVFPVMMVMLLGVMDLGNGILANQKAIRASQVTADLVTRNRSVSQAEINEAVNAGRLALEPFATASYGVDIVSIRFDDENTPEIVWRETDNMTAVSTVLTDVTSLASPGEGVVVVYSQYQFDPIFAGFVVDRITMRETAFSRGRKSPVVEKE